MPSDAPQPTPPIQPPEATSERLQEIAAAGWPATDTAWLGRWWLRAAEGFTGRANSVVPLGDPGVPLDEAAARTQRWYAERGLPAYAMVVLGSPADEGLRALGWRRNAPAYSHLEVMVQTHSVEGALATLQDTAHPPPAVTVELWDEPYDAWLALYRSGALPAVARRVLGHPRARFAALLHEGDVVAIARSVRVEEWVGISAVEVLPAYRRQGLARAVMRAVLVDAAEHGARGAYLQVADDNPAAMALYGAMGFTTHHRYGYLAAPGDAPGS
jgi:GNAT superfamily N-acetyltransferase